MISKTMKEMDKITFSHGSTSELKNGRTIAMNKRRDDNAKMSKENSQYGGYSFVSGFSSVGAGSANTKPLIPPPAQDDEESPRFYA